MLNRDHAAVRLQPFAGPLVTVVEEAWQSYLAEARPRLNRTTRANIVSDYMHAHFASHLPDAPALRSPRSDKAFHDVNGVAVRLKYLKGARSRNVATYAQMAINAQLQIPEFSFPALPVQMEFDDMPSIEHAAPPFVSVGYVLDPTESHVARVLAVYEHKGCRQWILDLRDLAAAGELAAVFPMFAPAATPLPALPSIGISATTDTTYEEPEVPQVVGEAELEREERAETGEGNASQPAG